MCGIAGAFHTRSEIDLGRLRRMSRLLRHRGPDDEGLLLADVESGGTWTLAGPDTPDEVLASRLRYSPGRREPGRHRGGERRAVAERYRVGLVHRRLSILDLSPAGHGPMSDPEGRYWITFNGEIYNYVELRAELQGLGDRFVTGCDIEVVIAAYRRFGPSCLDRFNGMFAFALWDAAKRVLFCARDRFGVKPFYYQWDGETFAFASEPKALILTQALRPRPRLEAVRDLVALDWVDHGRDTFFEDLHPLPAAHYLLVSCDGFAQRRWWSLDPERRAAGTPAEWRREFERLFSDSVRIRMRSDVEVGSCLSGGLDSSAVVMTAARLIEHPMHVFTCAYDEGPAFDERRYVRLVSRDAKALSHVVVPNGADFFSVFDRLTASQDEPTAGSGLYSQWKVMELAHQHGLKVLLDGQGGDETLAGYFRYLPARLRDLLAEGRLLDFARWFGPVADRLGSVTALGWTFGPWLPRGLVEPLRRRFGQGKDRVLARSLPHLRTDPDDLPRPPREFHTELSRQLAFDTLQRLLPSLLRYEDRNSMAFSIETRLPFLDYRLVEFVFSLPDDQRLDGDTTKAILRKSLADRIPRAVMERRDKMGFETPTDLWLRRFGAAELRSRLLSPSAIHEWIDPAALRTELEDFLAERRPIGLQIWRWLSIESWARQYIATDPRVPPEDPLAVDAHPTDPGAPLAASHETLVPAA
jgi:asparagine synthase (glutamine-hydrolysing)